MPRGLIHPAEGEAAGLNHVVEAARAGRGVCLHLVCLIGVSLNLHSTRLSRAGDFGRRVGASQLNEQATETEVCPTKQPGKEPDGSRQASQQPAALFHCPLDSVAVFPDLLL